MYWSNTINEKIIFLEFSSRVLGPSQLTVEMLSVVWSVETYLVSSRHLISPDTAIPPPLHNLADLKWHGFSCVCWMLKWQVLQQHDLRCQVTIFPSYMSYVPTWLLGTGGSQLDLLCRYWRLSELEIQLVHWESSDLKIRNVILLNMAQWACY